jgi:transposase
MGDEKNLPDSLSHAPILPGETWSDVPGYEGILQASTYGRVRQLVILNQTENGDTTYYKVGYRHEGERIYRNVHRLVALAFHGVPTDPKMVPDHKDTNKHNNRVENLEWVTRRENNHRAYKEGLVKHSLSEGVMDNIADMFFEGGLSMTEISRQLSVTLNQVKSVIQIWRAGDRPEGFIGKHERGRKKEYDRKQHIKQMARKHEGMSHKDLAEIFQVSEEVVRDVLGDK